MIDTLLVTIILLEGYVIWSLLKEVTELRDKLSQAHKITAPPVKIPKAKAPSEPAKKKNKWKYYD